MLKCTFTIALVALSALRTANGAERLSLRRQERPEKATPSNEAAVTEHAADLELWESNIFGALKGSSQKTNNSPPPGKGVTVNRQGAPGGCSLAKRGQNGGCGQGGKCKCIYGCGVKTNLGWRKMTCLSGNYEDCTDDNYCKYCLRHRSEVFSSLPGVCKHRCFCDYNGEKDHKEEESLKLMEGDGRFKGREANSYNGERGHKKEEGNSKPVEEDGRFEGGEDGNYGKDEDQKKEESNPKPVEDGDETASK